MSERIRISSQDLADPRVDAILSNQQGFGMQEPGRSDAQPLIFRPWFALMLAGLLGGLGAWAIIEPHFDDGIRFETNISSVSTLDQALPHGLSNVAFEASHARFLLPTDTRIIRADGKPGQVADLQEGVGVAILAEMVDRKRESTERVGFAKEVRILDHPVTPKIIDFGELISDQRLVATMLFPLAAAMIGLCIGAADGALSRAWRRAATCSLVGLLTGALGGFVALIPAGIIFTLGTSLARDASDQNSIRLGGFPLLIWIMGRGLAWAVVGLAAGLGQGAALKSKRLLLNGIIGGTVGALLGGVLFDPIAMVFSRFAHVTGGGPSRMVGLALVGAGTGLMIGLVELLAREAWVRILTGPIAGKEFILYRNPTLIGSSPKSEIYLFKDPQVVPHHASIHRSGEHYELRDGGSPAGTQVEGHPVQVARLKDRSRIAIGKTVLEFRVKDA